MMKIDLTGTHEENMTAINNAEISDWCKAHIRKDLQKQMNRCLDLSIEHVGNRIPIHELLPKGMPIKEYFGREQRLLRGESISYVKFN